MVSKNAYTWFEPGRKVAVITGAGISTDSGIPDFRSSEGLYNEKTKRNIPIEEVISIDFFEQYPKEFYEVYKEKLVHSQAQPNSGHLFLKELEDKGLDVTIITQNIDGLHQKAGSSRVLEVHGNAHTFVDKTGKSVDVSLIEEKDGLMTVNNEPVRPGITLYGEALDQRVIYKSVEAIRQADILLVMGTSLNVYPAAGLIYDYQGQKSILVNKGGTPLDAFFTEVFDGTIAEWVKGFKES